MPVSLNDRLVVAVASSALFDLSESDRVFRERRATAAGVHFFQSVYIRGLGSRHRDLSPTWRYTTAHHTLHTWPE